MQRQRCLEGEESEGERERRDGGRGARRKGNGTARKEGRTSGKELYGRGGAWQRPAGLAPKCGPWMACRCWTVDARLKRWEGAQSRNKALASMQLAVLP